MKTAIYLLSISFLACTSATSSPDRSQSDEGLMSVAWDMLWSRFRHPDTNLFYDFISSYEDGAYLDHLPTAEEVERQFPNPCGYGTGMEDSMILGGAILSMLTDRYAVTGDGSIRSEIRDVFSGVEKCVTVHGVPGFVARSICPEDGASVYINSSRDQYTHCVHGLWKYARSPLCEEDHQKKIGELLGSIADRMIETVIPENDFDSLRADGERDPLGISRMWKVQAHEAARLPMIYGAAWDITGDKKYHEQYLRYLEPAIQLSADPSAKNPAYALLQMQCSLELLHAIEKDSTRKNKIESCMKNVAKLASDRVAHVDRVLAGMSDDERSMLPPDWRTVPEWKEQSGYRIPQWGSYRHVWHHLREAGEARVVILMLPTPEKSLFSEESLKRLVNDCDYTRISGCGIVYHLAAFWKARQIDL